MILIRYNGHVFHHYYNMNNNINNLINSKVNASINTERRQSIKYNHTGTHLLHKALKEAKELEKNLNLKHLY